MSNLVLPDSVEKFLRQLLEIYPKEDFVTLRKVIGLGKVIYGEDNLLPGMPMTAAVLNTKPYTLVFGKKFIEENIQTMEEAVYLLSHELTHLVLDHFAKDIIEEFTEKKLGMSAVHIVVDCQVNATCYNSLLDEKYMSFVKRYYPKNEMPYCFFRPDGEPPSDELKSLHKKLFSKNGITNKELIDGLMPWFEEQQENLEEMIKQLLGNHKDLLKDKSSTQGQDSSLEELTGGVAKDLQDILKKNREDDKEAEKSEKQEDGKEPGHGTTLREEQIKICSDKIDYIKNIRYRLSRSFVINPSSKLYKAIDKYNPKKQVRSVIPNFHDRRTSLLYSMGRMPIFHKNAEIGSRVIVPCYVDVSGSQSHVLPYVLQVVPRLKHTIGDIVYCFSDIIDETKIVSLKSGKYKSTGGTNFNPVAEHILKNRYKCAVILTDGQAYLHKDFILDLKRKNVDITVCWTVPDPSTNPLASVAKKTLYLFDKDNYSDR